MDSPTKTVRTPADAALEPTSVETLTTEDITTEDFTTEGVIVTTATTRKVKVLSGDTWSDSEALTYALAKVRWYNRHRHLARSGSVIHDLLLLTTGAATTLTAALNADAWLTASLAATSFVLAGMMKVFRWRENWTSRSQAWAQLNTAVNHFRFLPPDKRDSAATARLVSHVDRIIASETRNSANVAHTQDSDDD